MNDHGRSGTNGLTRASRLALLAVVSIAGAAACKKGDSKRNEENERYLLEAGNAVAGYPPTAPTAVPSARAAATSNAPSCDMRHNDGPCFESLSDWALTKDVPPTCSNTTMRYSATACPRAGALGICNNVPSAYAGHVMVMYRTSQVLDVSGARTTCEGLFRGTFAATPAPPAPP